VSGEEGQEDIDEARQDQQKLLDVFDSEELRQLQMIAEFLRETSSSLIPPDFGGVMHVTPLAFGPDIILQCFEEQTYEPIISIMEDLGHLDEEALPILQDYLLYPLSQIWEERKVDGPPANAYKPIILDVIPGENDRCCRCDIVHGLELWDESNWSNLRRRIGPTEIVTFLKGRLANNLFEKANLTSTLLRDDFSFVRFMQEIYDIKTAAYDNWEKKDALCRACVVDVINCHLHLWHVEQKRKGGQHIPEDCWYGYNCRTQVHNYVHANKLNHCCEPTRGDK
jgi:hypothetical protein